MSTAPIKALNKNKTEGKYPWERVVKAYYNYYNTPETDPFFLNKPKFLIKRSPVLKVSISDAVKNALIKDEYTAKDVTDKGRLQLDVFSDCCKMMQHEMIINGAHIPLPLGMGELLISESFSQGVYLSKRVITEKKHKTPIKVKRYAVNTKGRTFKISWHKDKCRHSHVRFYTFESCIGTIDLDFDKPIYYGNQGLAARIAEKNNDPLTKDYMGAMYK